MRYFKLPKKPTKNKTRDLFLLILNILALLFSTESLKANNYLEGYKEYRKSNYNKAETLLKKSTREVNDNISKSKVYKILAIVQYMLGKRLDSESNLKNALSLNADIQITKDEVLDEGFIVYFNTIKKQYLITNPPPPPKSNKTAIVKHDIKTFILIKVTPQTTVLIDNKLQIQSGKKHRISPGNHQIKINQKGYKQFVLNIKVKEGILNEIPIQLTKEIRSSQNPHNIKQGKNNGYSGVYFRYNYRRRKSNNFF